MKIALHELLKTGRKANGIWGYRGDDGAIEPTCLALLALRRETGTEIVRAVQMLQHLQNADGSWSAFVGDEPIGCWTTGLTVSTLLAIGGTTRALPSAVHWLVNAKGRESNWFWRWKFRTVDKSVEFDPAKYGWSWVAGTTSWVIPTAFGLIALRQIKNRGLSYDVDVTERIDLGVSMLLDRMCPTGGWNAGNGIAFGVACSAYIDATAIALLALAGHENEAAVRTSLAWLVSHLSRCASTYSLAWGILALAAYREISSEVNDMLGPARKELAALIERRDGTNDICTLAVCALALETDEGKNVFEVRG
jgi:hypothetical protein